MDTPPTRALALIARCAGKCLPFRFRRKRIEILEGTPVEISKSGPDYSSKMQERFFIDLIPSEQFSVITKISKKPTELPKRTLGTVGRPEKEIASKAVGSRMTKRSARKGFWGSPFTLTRNSPSRLLGLEISVQE